MRSSAAPAKNTTDLLYCYSNAADMIFVPLTAKKPGSAPCPTFAYCILVYVVASKNPKQGRFSVSSVQVAEYVPNYFAVPRACPGYELHLICPAVIGR